MANGEEQSETSKDRAGGKRKGAPPSKQRADGPRLADAVSDARQSVETMVSDAREMVDEHPWRAVGMAVGAGYVLGGGLLTPFTGRLLYGVLRIGIRLAALPLIRDELMGLVQSATDRGRGETERRHQ
jgi:ElaB/YqjD/DUF883 family membrane-anchored ribosome-binding protein